MAFTPPRRARSRCCVRTSLISSTSRGSMQQSELLRALSTAGYRCVNPLMASHAWSRCKLIAAVTCVCWVPSLQHTWCGSSIPRDHAAPVLWYSAGLHLGAFTHPSQHTSRSSPGPPPCTHFEGLFRCSPGCLSHRDAPARIPATTGHKLMTTTTRPAHSPLIRARPRPATT